MTEYRKGMASAFARFQAGKLEEAEHVCREILQENGDEAEALHLLGIVCHKLGKRDMAIDFLNQAIARRPSEASFYNNFGAILQAMGRSGEAVECLRRAVALKPQVAEGHYNLGVALYDEGEWDEAVKSYRKALELNPNYAQAYNNLGMVYKKRNQLEQALEHFSKALRCEPRIAEAHYNSGLLYMRQGRVEEATKRFGEAVRLRPKYPEAHCDLGIALQGQGKLDQATKCFREALRLRPDYSEAHNNLGCIWMEQGKQEQAMECFRQALRFRTDYAEPHNNVGTILRDEGKIEEAKASFEAALRIKPEKTLWALGTDTLCPVVPHNNEEIELVRRRIDAALDRYQGMKLEMSLEDIPASSCHPSFYLAYHGRNERYLRKKFGDLFAKSFAPVKPIRRGGCPHIGFIVTNKHEAVFLRYMQGVIDQLPSSKFKISVICSHLGHTAIRPYITNPAVEFLTIPSDLAIAAEMLRDARCDILFFFEVGTDSINYFLPFLQLAPVQCTSGGFPVTSGVPSVDYFISSDLTEPEGAESHYTERLVRLKTLPTLYHRSPLANRLKGRSDFGLSETENLYICPQSLFKIHPDFDETLGNILRQDPVGKVILAKGKHSYWTELLKNRLAATIPDVVDRIWFMPRQGYENFLNIVALCEVMLDPLHFGGGCTTYDGLAVGTPIVTMPGEFMRGRVTFGCYKKMGVMDCVARTPEEYVDIAVSIAKDPSYRQAIQSKILEANEVLYEDIEAVRELEEFFHEAIQAARAA